jgi:tetratricopeptide (TPR) repeat protein
VAVALAIAILAAAGLATRHRNAVWSSSESVWRDAVAANPGHGRARMNLGVALMARGALTEALAEFEQAAITAHDYYFLEVNLGLVKAALHRLPEAEAHFRRAVTLAPDAPVGHFYYGRWLAGQQRYAEAVWYLERTVALSADDLRARQELMRALGAHRSFRRLGEIAAATLSRFPGESSAEAARLEAERGSKELEALKARMRATPSAEGWLDASLRFYNEGDYASSLEAAREALKYRPDYAEAFNNVAAASNALGRWNDAIEAARKAIALKPDFPLARNNLAWATAELAKVRR